MRRVHLNWLHGGKYHRKLGRYAPPGVRADRRRPYGAVPARRGARSLPAAAAVCSGAARVPADPPGRRDLAAAEAGRVRSARRAGGAVDTRRRGSGVKSTTVTPGSLTTCMFGTGYRVDVRRYPFLTAGSLRGSGGGRLSRAEPRDGVVGTRAALPRRARRLELRTDHAVRVRRLVRRSPLTQASRRPAPAEPEPAAVSVGRAGPDQHAGARGEPRWPDRGVGALVVGGDYQGLGIARSLGRRGVPVCVIDDETIGRACVRYVARFVRVPRPPRPPQATSTCCSTAERIRPQRLGGVPDPRGDGRGDRHDRDELGGNSASPRRTGRRSAGLGQAPHLSCRRIAWNGDAADVVSRRTEDEPGARPMSCPVVVKPAIKEHFFYATRRQGLAGRTPRAAA